MVYGELVVDHVVARSDSPLRSNLELRRAKFGRARVCLFAAYPFHARLRGHAAVGSEPLLSMAYLLGEK
jgi:hypothetical protein